MTSEPHTADPSETTAGSSRAVVVPDKPALEGLEATWSQRWKDDDTYAFDRTQPRENVYSIDTPPPTVSGSLHVGHVFSYTHTDILARFHRMRGRDVFYPMGWDDNGLPTERRRLIQQTPTACCRNPVARCWPLHSGRSPDRRTRCLQH